MMGMMGMMSTPRRRPALKRAASHRVRAPLKKKSTNTH